MSAWVTPFTSTVSLVSLAIWWIASSNKVRSILSSFVSWNNTWVNETRYVYSKYLDLPLRSPFRNLSFGRIDTYFESCDILRIYVLRNSSQSKKLKGNLPIGQLVSHTSKKATTANRRKEFSCSCRKLSLGLQHDQYLCMHDSTHAQISVNTTEGDLDLASIIATKCGFCTESVYQKPVLNRWARLPLLVIFHQTWWNRSKSGDLVKEIWNPSNLVKYHPL